MATCTPQALPREATCFRCIPPDAKQVAEIYLLNTLTGTLTARQLSAGAAQFRPITNKLALAAKVYLLTVISATMQTPAQLMAAAACWQCIPKSERLDVETYLFGASASSIDPQAIARQIGPYKSLYPIRDQVELYQLSLLAGSPSLASIISGAKCLMCLSTTRLEEIFLYLLCGGLMANLIPAGSVYSGLSEFDLVVLPNTEYLIVWGSHELYVNICGNVYYSTGAGTSLIVDTASCTLMRFFGTFGGTTVTAIVRRVRTPIPTPTGFTWTIVGANTVATWDPTPAGVFSVELWTSTDGLGYTLATTTANPTTTSSVAAPASGTVLYGKIRATSKVFPGYSAFTAPLVVSQDVSGWASRVVANGGAMPSANSIAAAANFVAALVSAGIFNKFRTLNMVAPDNLIAARTPLIVGTGLDPWPNVGAANFAAADLSTFGLHCDGTKALDTGVLGTSLSLSNAGITIIASVINPNNGLLYDMGYLNATNQEYMFVAASQSGAGQTGHSGGSSFSTGIIKNTGSIYAGYISYNRTSAVRSDLYYANNDIAHSSIGNNTNNQALGISATSLYFGAVHDSGGGAIPYYSKNTLSLGAVHDGLTATESLAFFNAANALRTSFGGGYGDIGNSYQGSWLQRIAAAGGAAPSAGTLAAAHTFATSLFSGGILGKIYTANVMAPDNLIACLTPLIYKSGSASWANNGGNLVLADLTINGIKGNASNKWMNTGWDISTLAPTAPTDIGFSIYISQTAGAASDSEAEIGQCPASANDMYIIRGWIAANQVSGVLGLGANIIAATWAKTGWTGYASVNRLTTTSLLLFAANSVTPHAQVGSNAVAPTAVSGSPTGNVFVLAANAPTFGVPNNPSSKRLSFAAIHQALALAESATLFNAIQAFRTSIGGGFI